MMNVSPMNEDQQLICTHCGDECADDSIAIEESIFCCEGCKTVFEILQDNDLCRYYDLDENAGLSLKGRRLMEYSWLDDPDVVAKLISFTDGTKSRIRFDIPQIHCTSCIWLLEKLYVLSEHILQSKVDFLKKELFIVYEEGKISLRDIVELLTSIGYQPEINLSNLDDNKARIASRSFYYKLGLAGFAFGNVMLFSFPEYIGLDKSADPLMFKIFGALNIILALPVLLYSGQDYLRSAWVGIKHGQLNIDVPVSLGILAIFGRSIFEIITQSGSGYLDSMVGLIFFLLLGKWFQQKTYHTLSFERDYKSYFPIAATLKDGNQTHSVVVDKLKAGHTIIVKNQELIPADGILLKGSANIDYSFVSGETDPVRVIAGEKIFAGGRQMDEAIEITLTKKVSQSYLTQLWNDPAFNKELIKKKSVSEIADRIGKWFTVVILLIAFTTLFYWYGKDVDIAINAFTAVLIIACPCAVALSIPFTFGNVLRILSSRGFFVKNTLAIEAIQRISHVILDKTGTITEAAGSSVTYQGKNLNDYELSAIKSVTSQSNHPLSQLITESLDADLLNTESFKEIPGKGLEAVVNGHPIRIGSDKFIDTKDNGAGSGAGVWIEIDREVKGHFQLHNAYRGGLKGFLQFFTDDYEVSLLSGDHEGEKTYLTGMFDGKAEMKFRQSPLDKLEYVKRLQSEGESVLMLGDGLNDAGALKQSNIGVVITENINNFTPACDAIVASENFGKIPDFIRFAKQSRQLVFYAYVLALIYNILGLSFAVQGLLSPLIAAILMPASSITVVLFGVLSSSYLARRLRIL
jgi:Cu+-exporting ATPase